MNYAVYCLTFGLIFISMIAAGVWLVVTEHYGWAWIPWLCVMGMRWKPPA